MVDLRTIFLVPPHILGPPVDMATPKQKARVLRSMAQQMGLPFEAWPQEAQDLECDEQLERRRREERNFATHLLAAYAPRTCRERIRDWFGR